MKNLKINNWRMMNMGRTMALDTPTRLLEAKTFQRHWKRRRTDTAATSVERSVPIWAKRKATLRRNTSPPPLVIFAAAAISGSRQKMLFPFTWAESIVTNNENVWINIFPFVKMILHCAITRYRHLNDGNGRFVIGLCVQVVPCMHQSHSLTFKADI